MKTECRRRYILVKVGGSPKDVETNIRIRAFGDDFKVIRLNWNHYAVRCTNRSIRRVSGLLSEVPGTEILRTSGTIKTLKSQLHLWERNTIQNRIN